MFSSLLRLEIYIKKKKKKAEIFHQILFLKELWA